MQRGAQPLLEVLLHASCLMLAQARTGMPMSTCPSADHASLEEGRPNGASASLSVCGVHPSLDGCGAGGVRPSIDVRGSGRAIMLSLGGSCPKAATRSCIGARRSRAFVPLDAPSSGSLRAPLCPPGTDETAAVLGKSRPGSVIAFSLGGCPGDIIRALAAALEAASLADDAASSADTRVLVA
jgi:hypothetical protein